jgi:hypothetical protein
MWGRDACVAPGVGWWRSNASYILLFKQGSVAHLSLQHILMPLQDNRKKHHLLYTYTRFLSQLTRLYLMYLGMRSGGVVAHQYLKLASFILPYTRGA